MEKRFIDSEDAFKKALDEQSEQFSAENRTFEREIIRLQSTIDMIGEIIKEFLICALKSGVLLLAITKYNHRAKPLFEKGSHYKTIS